MGITLDMASPGKPSVLVYTEPLLARSMTFVRSQTEALASFSPYYVAPRYMRNGLSLPRERVLVMHRGEGRISQVREVPFKALGIAPLFARRLRKLRPVLIHAHFGPMGLRVLPLARKLGIPLVVTFHGYDATVPDEHARRSPYHSHRNYIGKRKQLERGAELLIAVSDFVRRELLRQGFSSHKIAVHYIGVDTQLFHPDTSVKRKPVVLFVGRLAEVKGCTYLIQAMADVQSLLPEVGLVVIGDGPLRATLEKQASQTLRRFHFLGYQPPEVVRQWMSLARVFAAPSLHTPSGSEEGFPTVLVEAQAMGLPAVSSFSGGISEAVAHEETGLLGPEADVQELAKNILCLLQNDPLWQRMSSAAERRVRERFSLETQTRKLEQIYESVLSRYGQSSVRP